MNLNVYTFLTNFGSKCAFLYGVYWKHFGGKLFLLEISWVALFAKSIFAGFVEMDKISLCLCAQCKR